jgi:hypothetical protein
MGLCRALGRRLLEEDGSVLKGLLAGGITLGVAAVFPQELVFPFFAVVLGLVAGTFPGLAMAESEEGFPKLEWTVAVGLVAVGMAGLWRSPAYLAWAWIGHGLWSLLHRFTALGDGVGEEYPVVCLTFDLVAAGFVTYVWLVGG